MPEVNHAVPSAGMSMDRIVGMVDSTNTRDVRNRWPVHRRGESGGRGRGPPARGRGIHHEREKSPRR